MKLRASLPDNYAEISCAVLVPDSLSVTCSFCPLWEFSGFLSYQCFEISVTSFCCGGSTFISFAKHFQSQHLRLVLGNFSESLL